MIKVTNLSCSYDKNIVLDDISFDVKKNQKVGIIGANGCGKTTLLKACAGLVKFSGDVEIEDKSIKGISRKELSKKVALMSQISQIFFPYTVYDTIKMGRYVHNKNSLADDISKPEQDFIYSIMENMGIIDIKDKSIEKLSGGQLQRVYLARVFAQEPQIILLDEPTNHLDIQYQLELVCFLNEWVKKDNNCVISVLHDINLALEFSEHIFVMDKGKFVYDQSQDMFDVKIIDRIYNSQIQKYMIKSLSRWSRGT